MMNRKDLTTLAANMRKRDSFSRNTTVSLVFSISVLFIVLFLGVSITSGLYRTTNEYMASRTIRIKAYDDYGYEMATKGISDESIEEINVFKQSSIVDCGRGFYVVLDGKRYPISDYKGVYSFNAIDRLFFDSEYEYMSKRYDSDILVCGDYCKSPDEIILSSELVDAIGVSCDDVVGRVFSWNGDELLITGVFDKRVCETVIRNDSHDLEMLMFITWDDGNSSKCINYYNITFGNYLDAVKAEKIIDNNYRLYMNEAYFISDASGIVLLYSSIENLYNAFIITFLIFSTVILISTLINIYVTTSYRYKKSRGYIAILRAIGMRLHDVKRVIGIDILMSTLKSSVISGVIGFVFAIATKLIFDGYFSQYDEVFRLRVDLWIYLPIVFGVGLLIFLFNYLIYFSIYKTEERHSIVDVLKSE